MSHLLLLLLAADPNAALDGFERAWAKGDLDAALALVSDDARVTFVMDPADALDKRVADQAFSGKDEVRGLLWSFLPGLELKAGERSVAKEKVSWRLELKYPWLKRLGLDVGHFDAVAHVGPDGKVASLRLALSAEDAARAVPALPPANKAVVRHFIDEVNKRNFGVVDDVLTPSFVQHSMVVASPGREGVRKIYRDLQSAFPDFHFDLNDVVADSDLVAVRMVGRYTHKGEFLGIAPTGKALQLIKMDFFRFVNGRCNEHWDSADRLGLLQQMGTAPRLPQWSVMPGYEGFR